MERTEIAQGKFHAIYQDVSGAIGDVRGGWPKEGHPFNLALVRLRPARPTRSSTRENVRSFSTSSPTIRP
jgi:hypothetical protein